MRYSVMRRRPVRPAMRWAAVVVLTGWFNLVLQPCLLAAPLHSGMADMAPMQSMSIEVADCATNAPECCDELLSCDSTELAATLDLSHDPSGFGVGFVPLASTWVWHGHIHDAVSPGNPHDAEVLAAPVALSILHCVFLK